MKHTTLLFLLKDGEILLAMKKRGFGAGRWNGTGGKIEVGETKNQAVIRECKEEINVTPLDCEEVATHIFTFENAEPDIITHTFICRKWQGRPKETEEMSPHWFKINQIPYDEMWQDDILWLPLILRGKKLSCTFSFDNDDNLLSAQIEIRKDIE